MSILVQIKDLSFSYKKKEIFKNLELTLDNNKWYTLIGSNGSGKTTLVKILTGILNFDGNIMINDLVLNDDNIYQIRQQMAVLFDNVDTNIVEDNVLDELTFQLRNINMSKEAILEHIEDIDKITNIKRLIDKEVFELSLSERYELILATALINKPKMLILDETFSLLSKEERLKLYSIISHYRDNNELTVLNITHELEDSLLGDNIIVLKDQKVLVNDAVIDVYNNGYLDLMKYRLPFVVEVSEALKLYDLVDRKYYDIEELINKLWN